MDTTMKTRAWFLALSVALVGCESQRPAADAPPTADELGRLRLIYEEQLRERPAAIETRVSLARVLFDLGHLDQSMDQFQMVLRADSLHVGALMGLSEVMAQIRDHATALSLAQRAVAAQRNAETLGEARGDVGSGSDNSTTPSPRSPKPSRSIRTARRFTS